MAEVPFLTYILRHADESIREEVALLKEPPNPLFSDYEQR